MVRTRAEIFGQFWANFWPKSRNLAKTPLPTDLAKILPTFWQKLKKWPKFLAKIGQHNSKIIFSLLVSNFANKLNWNWKKEEKTVFISSFQFNIIKLNYLMSLSKDYKINWAKKSCF